MRSLSISHCRASNLQSFDKLTKAVEGQGAIGDDIMSWLLSFFFHASLVGLIGYQLMCLGDLEFDYMNPYDSSSQINKVILPEFIIQGVLCFIHLATGHWFMFLFSLPYLYYNVRLYKRGKHLLDVTEIFNQLNWAKQLRIFKLVYVILLLVISIFWTIWSIGEAYD